MVKRERLIRRQDLVSAGDLKDALVIVLLDETADLTIAAFQAAAAKQDVVALIMDVSKDNSVETLAFPAAKKSYIRQVDSLPAYPEEGPYPTRFPDYIIQGLIICVFW